MINGIVIGGTILVVILVYWRLSASFRKRLTAYFLRAVCGSFVVSLAVLGGILLLEELLANLRLWEDFFYGLGYSYGLAATYLNTVLTVAPPLICFVAIFSLKINRRVRYVEYLSQEVERIKEEGFGGTMELQGGRRTHPALRRHQRDVPAASGKGGEGEEAA